MALNIIKLSVGTQSLQDLERWQSLKAYQSADGFPQHVTRMWPKREAEILGEGSIYWVIKGTLLCRQRILRFDKVVRADGIERCAIVCDPELIRVQATPRRAFQGWRYLSQEDAPADLPAGAKERNEAPLPPKLEAALSEMGLI